MFALWIAYGVRKIQERGGEDTGRKSGATHRERDKREYRFKC